MTWLCERHIETKIVSIVVMKGQRFLDFANYQAVQFYWINVFEARVLMLPDWLFLHDWRDVDL